MIDDSSLISRNHAGGQDGGVENLGDIVANDLTVVHNVAAGGGGGIEDDAASQATTHLNGAVVTKNKPGNCEPLGGIAACTG